MRGAAADPLLPKEQPRQTKSQEAWYSTGRSWGRDLIVDEARQVALIQGLHKRCSCCGLFYLVDFVFHFLDKPPVVAVIKAFMLALGFNALDLLRFVYITNTPKFVGNILKDVLRVPRPLWCVPGLVPGRASVSERSYSFPSGHVLFLSGNALAAVLWYPHLWYTWILYVVLSVIMGVSRVRLAMHWPQDIVLSLLIVGVLVPFLYYADAFSPIASDASGMLSFMLGYTLLLSAAFVICDVLRDRTPPQAAHSIKADRGAFKTTLLGTELRDNAHTAGLAVGAYILWMSPEPVRPLHRYTPR